VTVDIWNVLKEFGPIVKLFCELIVMAANGWGDILAAMRPVWDIMGKLIGMGWDFVQVLKSAANVLTSIATGDFQGLKQALKEIGGAAGDLAKKTSEASAMAMQFPESVAASLGERDAAKQAAQKKVDEARAKKEYADSNYIPGTGGLRKPTYATGDAGTKKTGSGAGNAIESWASKMRDLDTDMQKALSPYDELARKIEDIKNKYTDLVFQARKYATEHGKAFDTGKVEEWRKVMEEAARAADAEKKLQVWTAVERQITDKTAPELQKRLAAEDEWLRETQDKLRKAGFSQEEISGKMVQVAAAAAEKKKKIELDYINTVMEAETGRYLAQLDMMEKERSGSKAGITRQRISTYESRLASYQQRWENETDPMAKLTLAEKVDNVRSKLVDLNITLKEQEGLFTEGLGRGLRDYLWDMKSVFQQGVYIAQETARSMSSAFSDFFFDAFEGKLNSLWDYVKAFATSVKRVIADSLGQQASGALSTGIGSLIQGIVGGGSLSRTATGSIGIPSSANYVPGVHHGGGKVRRFVPVFHGGGLNTDERLVVNRVGERYINEEQNDWLTHIARVAGQSPGGNTTIIFESGPGVPALTGKELSSKRDTTGETKRILLNLVITDPAVRAALGIKGA